MAVVVSMVVFFILALSGVISANPFKLGFAIFAFGIGGIFTLYGLVTKGGYETTVGYILLTIAVAIILIGVLVWYGIVFVAVAMLAFGLLLLLVLKSDLLVPQRTDEKEGYKPYAEVLAEKKAEDARKEAEPLPTLKDYSKED